MSAKEVTVQMQSGNTNAGGDVNTGAVPLPVPCQYRRQDTYLFAVTLMPQLFMQLLKSKVLRCFLV